MLDDARRIGRRDGAPGFDPSGGEVAVIEARAKQVRRGEQQPASVGAPMDGSSVLALQALWLATVDRIERHARAIVRGDQTTVRRHRERHLRRLRVSRLATARRPRGRRSAWFDPRRRPGAAAETTGVRRWTTPHGTSAGDPSNPAGTGTSRGSPAPVACNTSRVGLPRRWINAHFPSGVKPRATSPDSCTLWVPSVERSQAPVPTSRTSFRSSRTSVVREAGDRRPAVEIQRALVVGLCAGVDAEPAGACRDERALAVGRHVVHRQRTGRARDESRSAVERERVDRAIVRNCRSPSPRTRPPDRRETTPTHR